MTLSPQITESRGETSANSQKQISVSRTFQISKKAWTVRVVTIGLLLLIFGYNLNWGLKSNDSLVVYSTLMSAHTLTIFVIGWILYRSKSNGKIPNDLVSVIIPIYNQESMIEDVIDAIFRSTYRNIDVIAVNDGSKDSTKEILDELEYKYPSLKVIHKENGGKRTAVATGFYASKGEYIILIDSDSIINEHAIAEFMKTFNANPRIGAVSGCGKVLNAGTNILTKLQDAWYDFGFNLRKAAQSTFGCVLCCSGCLAGYRREAIANFIPYYAKSKMQFSDDRTLTTYAIATPWAKRSMAPIPKKLMISMAQYDDAEDRGLTSQALVEWETVYVQTAVVHTEVPDTLSGYFKQQLRWKKGYIRSNFFVSAFFWRKNPIMSLLFYLEFMAVFTRPLIIFVLYFYSPFILHNFWLPVTYIVGQVLLGLAAGIDYRFRDPRAKYWIYKPLMNLITLFILSWLIFPAIITYRKNSWLTR